MATNGLSDRSLRDVAASVGTSHRLLLYHFGSRPGLLTAVVERVESDQRAALRELADGLDDPVELVRALWQQVSAEAVRPLVRLFFEAIAYAAQGADAERLTGSWLDESESITAGLGIEFDAVEIRLGIAVVRGLLIDVVVTGDVAAADASLERFLQFWRN